MMGKSINKTALITGATSGIGLAYAEYFASLDNNLILTGTSEELNAVASRLRTKYSVDVVTIVKRIDNLSDVDRVISALNGRKVHVLVNNAGYAINAMFFDRAFSDYQAMINLHVIASLRLIEYVYPMMEEDNSGIIINVSSLSADLPIPGNAIYSATKAFLKKFTEGLYLDIRKRNLRIRTLVVCPGFTKTRFHEKIGISKEEQRNFGFVRWSSPERVVEESMRDLAKGKVVSVTGGFSTLFQIVLYRILPQKIFYNVVLKMFT